jgi:hypothetical protein
MDNNEQIVRDIFKDTSKVAWVQLDVPFDVNAWQEEVNRVLPYYVEHREKDSVGWSSCCLHGLAIDKTNGWEFYTDRDQGYDWTALTELTPAITEFWKHTFPAESYKRIRFMKLAPGGRIDLHRDCEPESLKDFDPFVHDMALNLAITHPKECSMEVDGNTVPWRPGMSIILNVSKDHVVTNNSNQDRVHMIAHFKVGNKKEEFSKLVADSWKHYHG